MLLLPQVVILFSTTTTTKASKTKTTSIPRKEAAHSAWCQIFLQRNLRIKLRIRVEFKQLICQWQQWYIRTYLSNQFRCRCLCQCKCRCQCQCQCQCQCRWRSTKLRKLQTVTRFISRFGLARTWSWILWVSKTLSRKVSASQALASKWSMTRSTTTNVLQHRHRHHRWLKIWKASNGRWFRFGSLPHQLPL